MLNSYRAKHGAAPLALDPEVTRTAQEWADYLQATDKFEHRPNNIYGENLYAVGSSTRTLDSVATRALQTWYSESRGYDYSREYTAENVDYSKLHFTAMVWQSSTLVGVGLAQGRNGTFVVLNFAKRGNTLGKFVENVRPPV
ncbi:serine protease [Lentzea sp. NBRC 105346]|nr:serine protease [Lentzea sp. NBRC 105346]